MINLYFNVANTLTLSIILYLLGGFIKAKTNIFNKLCIPTPVIGGLLFALTVFFLDKFNIAKISMDTSLMPYFLCIFFVSIGLCIDVFSVRCGGRLLFIYWLLCAALGFFQNLIAVLASKFLNIEPILGFMCGSVSMEGGHGYALAFGKTVENIGIENASSIGIAAATVGLIMGGILGGPIGKYLIKKHRLKPADDNYQNVNKTKIVSKTNPILLFFENTLVLLLIMNVAFFVANTIYIKTNILIPDIVIGMIIAVLVSTVNLKSKLLNLDLEFLNLTQDITLGVFLTMALMSIDINKISNLFSSIIIIIFLQVVFVLFYAVFICFKVLGKNYDSAVMISGLVGHTLGATPNAIANMDAITKKYGNSKISFLIVPMVGAFLLDAFSIPCILFFINFLK